VADRREQSLSGILVAGTVSAKVALRLEVLVREAMFAVVEP